MSSLCGLHGLFLVFSLGLGHGFKLSLGATIEDLLPVFVHLQLNDLDVGGVDADLKYWGWRRRKRRNIRSEYKGRPKIL